MATKQGKTVAVHKQNVPAGADNFEFDLDIAPFNGYDSTTDPTIVEQHILVRGSQNVYQKISGTIANRPGRKLIDSVVDATQAPIKSAFIWNTSLGFSYAMRVANGNLQFFSAITGTGAWYTLMSSLATANQRVVFSPWFDNVTDKKDLLLWVMHDKNTYKWDGGVALFVSAINNTSITLDRTAITNGFASSGTVTINGTTYAYSGVSGSTLTGVTGDASAQAVNSVVYSTVKTNSNIPTNDFTNDFIKVVNNQLYSGSYTDQRIFLSKNTDYTDHSSSATRLTGEGDTIILDDTGKGIGVFQGQAVCFAGTSLAYLISFTQLTVGSVLGEQTKRQIFNLGNLVAAQGHEFIDTLSDNVLYLDQNNQLRSLGNFKNFFTTKAVIMSLQVQTELSEENFTGGSLRVVNDARGDLCYITAPISGKTYLYLERITLTAQGDVVTERIWQPPQQWNISRVDSFNGVTIGFSNSNPQMYQLWDTLQYHDDSPSGQLPYTSIMLTGYHNGNQGRRQGKRIFEKVFWEGYATPGTQLYGALYYDYQGSTTLLSVIISDKTSGFTTNQLFTGLVPPSLGDASLGDNPLGDGLNTLPDDQATLAKFRVINDVQPIDCFEYALMVYSSTADDRWEIISLGTNARVSESQAAEIRK